MEKKITLPMNVRPLAPEEKLEDNTSTRLYEHISSLLGEWKNHRKVTIESDWTKAFQNFNGEFDERNKESNSRSTKKWRSRAFYPLTEQKVTAAQAQLQDILFKGGRFPYDIKGTPLPDDPAILASNEAVAQGGDPTVPNEVVQEASMTQQILSARIKNMKKRMDDQFAECDAASVGLISIFDGGLYGTAFLESPRVERRKRHKWVQGKKGFQKKEVYEDVPTVSNLDPWSCWPDPECGGIVQNGIGFFHLDKMSAPGIHELYSLVFPEEGKMNPDAGTEEYEYDYIKDEFDKLLNDIAEGAISESSRSITSSEGPNTAKESGNANKIYEVYKFAGKVMNKFLSEHMEDLEGGENSYTEVIMSFCNKRIIKCVANPFPGERRPYHMVPWTKVPGSAFGRGIAKKIFDAQMNVNRLMRMYIDNKRLSGNLMTAVDKSKLKNGESLEIYPGRNWEFQGAFQEGDIRKHILPITFPDVTAGVLEAIGTMVQWADQSSGVPRILEGQPGTDSSTAYAENQRIAAASKQLGLVLKNYDMHAWVPIVESFYDWNMEFLKDDEVKGDFNITATGFATFENRHLKKLDLERLLLMSQQLPALQVKIKSDPIVEDWAIASNIDPERYMLTPAEVAAKMTAQKEEQLANQQAGMQMEQQKEFMEHQFEIQMEQVKGQISGETRMALAQIDAAVKTNADNTKKLTTLANIEAKEKTERKDNAQGRRGNSNKR